MLVRTHARTILSFGLALGLAIACSDDDSGGDDDDDNPTSSVGTTTPIVPTGTVTSNPSNAVQSATTNPTTNQAATSSTGTTGMGGNAGSGGSDECDPDPNSGLPTGSEGGAAGGAGAPPVSYDDGFHFTDPESVTAWRLKPVADCAECIADATLEAGCGTMVMTANWPEEANTGTLKSTAELNAQGEERWDLTGQTLTVRARWLSGGDTVNNGFDVYLELLDEEYDFYGPTLGETFDSGETYAEWSVPVPSAPEGDFDPATVRQINVRFDTKFWTEDEPTFAYETSIFEIDAIVW